MVVLIEIPKVHCRLCFDQLWSEHIQTFQGLFVDNETTEHDVFDNEFVPSSQWLFADRYPSNTEMKMSSLCFCQQSSPNREFFVFAFYDHMHLIFTSSKAKTKCQYWLLPKRS